MILFFFGYIKSFHSFEQNSWLECQTEAYAVPTEIIGWYFLLPILVQSVPCCKNWNGMLHEVQIVTRKSSTPAGQNDCLNTQKVSSCHKISTQRTNIYQIDMYIM